MQKILSFSSILLLFAALIFVSCQKESISTLGDSFSRDDVSSMRNYLITEYGFSDSNIQETPTGFVVEGDVVFPKKNFWLNYKHDHSPNAKHYRSQNKVTATTTINVGVDAALPTAWRTAFQSAVTNWNNLNGKIKFNYLGVISYCPVNGINVYYSSLGSNGTFAQTSNFPTSGGAPGNSVTVNSTCTVSQTAAQKLKTAAHELGHCIGFMHTDVSSGYSQITTSNSSCNTGTDASSIMNQGLMNFSAFSTCDKAAFSALYP